MQGSYYQSEAERRVAVGALNTRVMHYVELNQAIGCRPHRVLTYPWYFLLLLLLLLLDFYSKSLIYHIQ